MDPALRDSVVAQALSDMSPIRTCTLITYPAGEDYPRLRAMGFVFEGWKIYVSTKRIWQKAREIEGNPKVSVTIVNQNIRRDHFIQIDGVAVPVEGEEFAMWQERRFAKEGDLLRRAAAGMTDEDWAGWRIEPVRLRINGYINEGPFREVPVVALRKSLGLPPLP